MPNIITHKIFAEEVLKQLEKQEICFFYRIVSLWRHIRAMS